MAVSTYFLTLCLPLATLILIFGMRYLSAVMQARARYANDEGYRRLADKAAGAQADAASALASMDANLAEVRTRLAAVEKMLKDVE